MYAIHAYIGVVLGVNVGIYGIHGVFGFGFVVFYITSSCGTEVGESETERLVLET